jgi:hypothetical protein
LREVRPGLRGMKQAGLCYGVKLEAIAFSVMAWKTDFIMRELLARIGSVKHISNLAWNKLTKFSFFFEMLFILFIHFIK